MKVQFAEILSAEGLFTAIRRIFGPQKFLATALCSSLGSLGKIVNCKKPLEISVPVYISKPQYYRALIKDSKDQV